MPAFARAMERLGTETAFEVLARAKALEAQGKEIVHLEIGEPDFDTPANIIAAAKRALDEGYTHYGPSAGLPAFRELIAQHVSDTRGIPFGASNVVVTPGAKPIMFYVMLAVLDSGDEVLYPNPGFPIYESVIRYLDAKPVPLPLRQENEFRLDLDDLKRKLSPKTKLLILNSPHNPTGGMLPPEDIAKIAGILAEYPQVWILSDEIYSRTIYEGRHLSIATQGTLRERTVILDGFSKTYAMTGWRLGYGVMPDALSTHVARLATNCNSCTASFVQMAGMEALKGPQDEPERMRREFLRRRDHLVKGLNRIPGIRCLLPQGAFYVFPDFREMGLPTREVATRLLDDFGVAALSGTAFGEFGDGHIRFSYANSIENLDKALNRIDDFVRALAHR
jgi:aspartate/methionine/tyrosine aminotransferase